MRITAGPYLQDVSRNGITVMWHTDEPGSSRVEFQRADRLGWSTYDPPKSPDYPLWREESGTTRIHAVRLSGLDDGWCYHYRVASRFTNDVEVVSEGATFRTAPGPRVPFRFATYGDALRTEPHAKITALVRGMRPDLCVGAGDMSQDHVATYPELMFDPAAKMLRYTPWYSTMGNHDSPNEGFFRYFRFPQPRYWYGFDYGCAHFTILNTCMDYRPGSEQWLWLEQELAHSAEACWKFVFFHHPPYCSSNCEIEGTRMLCPLFEQHNVDIVFNAHATRYERSHPLSGGMYDNQNGIIYIVSGGGGYDLSLSPSIHWDHLNPTAAAVMTANHFLLASVAPGEVAIQAIDEFGAVFDMVRYTKSLPQTAADVSRPHVPSEVIEPNHGELLAGLPQDAVRWVLPSSSFSCDDTVKRGEGKSIRWCQAVPDPICPAIRRVLCDDGKAREVVGGKAFAVTGWVRTEDLDGGVTMGFEWSGDMGFLGRVDCTPVLQAKEWTLVQIVTPKLPDYVYWCRVVLSALPGTTGTAWFDDIDVREM